MKTVFRDINHHNYFVENGYVKLSILDKDEIYKIRNFYSNLTENLSIKNSVYGIYVSLDDKNLKLKTDTMHFIQSLVKPKLDKYLKDYKVHLGGFIIKQSDDYSYTYPHQDWIFSPHNETDSFSATIWISMDDLTPNSGSLGFIPGSHQIFDGIIGSPSSYFINATQGHEDLLFNYLTFPEINAGDAFVFNNKCVHGANPNILGGDRIIVGIGITPIDSKLTHYFLKPGTKNKVLQLEVPENFFLTHMNDDLIEEYEQGKIPNNCQVISEFEYENVRFTQNEITELLDKNGVSKGKYQIKRPIQPEQENLNYEEIKVKKEKKNYYKEYSKKLIQFSKIYTPYNIYKESKYRLTGKY